MQTIKVDFSALSTQAAGEAIFFAFQSRLDSFKEVNPKMFKRAEEEVAKAKSYITQGIAGKEHPWHQIVKKIYQKMQPSEPFFQFIKDIDHLVGLYEVNIWDEGQMGCPSCGEHVPAFLRVIDGDEGIACNYCWFKP